MGGTRLKFEFWKVSLHAQNTFQSHFYCLLKGIWILKSRCSLSSWSSQLWVLCCRQRLHHSLRTAGRSWLTYQSKLTVFLSLRGMVATWPDLEEENATICFEILFSHLNFTDLLWDLTWKDPHSWLLLSFGIVLKDPCFVTSSSIPEATRYPPSNFISIMCAPTTQHFFCCSVKLWGTQRAQRFKTRHWSCRTLFTLPNEMPSASCSSSCVIMGSSLISNFTLTTFSTVMAVTLQP